MCPHWWWGEGLAVGSHGSLERLIILQFLCFCLFQNCFAHSSGVFCFVLFLLPMKTWKMFGIYVWTSGEQSFFFFLFALTQLHSLPAWYMCAVTQLISCWCLKNQPTCTSGPLHTISLSGKHLYLGSTFALWLTPHFLDRSWLKFWASLESFPVHFSSMRSFPRHAI